MPRSGIFGDLCAAHRLFLQSPAVYESSARAGLRALFFISNFWYARSSEGYFADSVLDQFFLHTWSLSVEWQFYLLYPLILLLWFKLGKSLAKNRMVCSYTVFLILLTAVFAILSFALPDRTSSYFMLHCRAWEQLIGGVVYVLPCPKLTPALARSLEITCLAIITANIMLVSAMEGWEPHKVAPGVIAAAGLLYLSMEKSLLSPGLLQYLGKISYSMYLIHWPVAATLAKLNLFACTLPLLVFILIYSALSYHFVETRRNRSWLFVIFYLAAAGGCQALVRNDGMPWRVPSFPAGSYHDQLYAGRGIPTDGKVTLGKLNPDQIHNLLAGDSYARQYANFFNEKIPFVGIFNDSHVGYGDFAVYFMWEREDGLDEDYFMQNSRLFRNNVAQYLASADIDAVVIAHHWRRYFGFSNDGSVSKLQYPHKYDTKELRAGITESLLHLADEYPNKQFYLVGSPYDSPLTPDMLFSMQTNSVVGPLIWSMAGLDEDGRFTPDFTEINEINRFVSGICEQRPNMNFIDPNIPLCDRERCQGIIDNMLAFSDGGHLSINGAALVGQYILQEISKNRP